MITLTGKKISEGIAIGKLTFYKRDIKEIKRIYVKDVEKEIQRYKKAREKAIAELELVYDLSVREVGEANAAIFEMQKELLEDQEYTDHIIKRILEEKLNAEYIVQTSVEQLIRISSHQQNNPIQGKEEDVRDVAIRVIRILSRSWKDRMLTDEPFVMAARDIYPSEALQFDKAKVLGFVTMYGTINSHTAVLARTKGIPAVIGLGESLKEEYDGKTIIIDGYEGKIYIEPDYATLTKMRERKDANLRHVRNLERLKGKENITQSGQRIDICANVGTREDIENVLRSDAGGIGLFRSEFLYMEMGSKLPSEEQLFQVYKLAAESMGANRVVVRIADFGGDKMVESVDLGEQANPAIGLRGIRIMMEKEELFLPQFRAILRASALGNVSIMFPMITSMEEVAAAKALLEKAKKQLKDEKTAYNENIEIGVMIETPAAVMISGELAREVDFFSIGTNDLLQLTLGMDRENPKLDKYYNPYHPALMKMIRIVANNVHLEGKRISICGDLAADLSMTEFFVQIGIDELSVAPHQVLGLRKKIREIQ
ncbi:phosphoenolpyruvate--protein phosphotransferase [Dorea formicigenerans]|uniref:Phosphoenolpyruvate-protein phosphotransferase n=1 Tax=Dorea formicigenerans TaxID=39486 RepID=A0A3E4FAE9_9FIRM|nr:phosphoenolpyruvate--protein phosphotransferase [Dorea formicigenerans]RGI86600.1 phosphoenolpyruvate--protein phosphotransferase [Dorea formicigenerans]RGI89776.1 phosphoenolpyruvate--protein phosphotransferase [Dorea formicigenerans]RGR57506.1 phosphoenolpyruvate--protein phosphotransferase [Dorea formicigenerans]RGT08430.1 phosphoenolpyruvate--protein phosphotransferase [Dorea formicigenerans]RGW54459.1 phosphoenolpyruvate--protein phosphotransferase [Dorea formicigenerans]